jgi:hypothetical protein
MAIGEVKGIKLPYGKEQVITQCTENTSFTLSREEVPVRKLMQILNTFCLASGLVINCQKLSAYWKDANTPWPGWTNLLGVV